jgi:hypothetical protein
MHIEKNVFENIFNTVMDMKGKTKDIMKKIRDIYFFFCYRKNIKLIYVGSWVAKPKTGFVLYKNV